jgi:hypothetical protein
MELTPWQNAGLVGLNPGNRSAAGRDFDDLPPVHELAFPNLNLRLEY